MKNFIQVLLFLLSTVFVRSQYEECITALSCMKDPVEPVPGPAGPAGPPGPPGKDFTPDPNELELTVMDILHNERNRDRACFGGVYRTSSSKRVCLLTAKGNFAKSQQKCNDLGSGWDLATSTVRDDNIRNEIVENLIKPNSVAMAWVGLTDQTNEGTWSYIDGVAAPAKNVSPWGNGEPNNLSNEDCAHIWNAMNYLFNDLRCNHEEPNALCEFTPKK